MSQEARSSSKPTLYDDLNIAQQRSWRRNTRKFERNEQLRSEYPPYHPSSNINIIYLHHRTKLETVDQLIKEAKKTKQYALDTESQQHGKEAFGALIQIQFVQSNNYSTVIMFEIYHLPNRTSLLYKQMEELWAIIFNNDNQIITWGTLSKELENFQHIGLINSGKTKKKINLQSRFQDRYGQRKPHPEKESRKTTTGKSMMITFDTPGDYSDEEEETNIDDDNTKTSWSLQEAVAFILGRFLNKEETINRWGCGLDLELETWRKKIFSKHHYNKEEEQQKRSQMVHYATHDCTAVVELFNHMYPSNTSPKQQVTETTTTARKITINFEDSLADINEDELINMVKPRFDRQKPILLPFNEEPTTLIINTTQEEMEQFNYQEQQQQQMEIQVQLTAKQKKKEQQRRKNEKFKLKKKYQPNFQNKIKRPIYYKYNWQNIRAQLRDDNIFPTHQTTINRKKGEVMIVFRSKQEQEQATATITSNYFSRDQYYRRWIE